MPEISIITPCYNAIQYLPTTAQSVLNQTYKDWEWIICDDGSTDGTSVFLEELEKSNSKIKVRRSTGKTGPSQARNLCIRWAQGRYLAFIDADDLWVPEKLEWQLEFIKSHGSALCCTYYRNMDSSGMLLSAPIKFPLKTTNRILMGSSVGCLTMMVDRSQVGDIVFKDKPIEDFLLWCELTSRGFVVDCMPKETAFYRLVPRSRGRNKFKIMVQRWELLRSELGLRGLERGFYFFIYVLKSFQKQKRPIFPI